MVNEHGQQSDIPKRACIDGPPPHDTCSFCGKGREESRARHRRTAGGYICNACVVLCNTILTEKEDPPEISS